MARACADDPWASVSAGDEYVCGLHPDGCAECWGYGSWAGGTDDTGRGLYDYGAQVPPSIPLAEIDIDGDWNTDEGDYHACGLTFDQQAVCWGRDLAGEATPPAGEFTEIAVTIWGSCALAESGDPLCWGEFYGDWDYPGATGLDSLSAGYDSFGALDADGEIALWAAGVAAADVPRPPAGPFRLLSVSAVTCAVRLDPADDQAALECWYPWQPDLTAYVPSWVDASEATALSVTREWTCLLESDGSPVCWSPWHGYEWDVEVSVALTSIDCAANGCCGVSADGEMACWSDRYTWDQFDPPGSYDVSPGPVDDG